MWLRILEVGDEIGEEGEGNDGEEHEGGDDGDGDGGLAGADEVGVGGLEVTEFDEPADDHDRGGDGEEPEAEGPEESQEGKEADEEEGADGPGHDLEIAGVADGLIDAGEGFGRGGGGVVVEREGTEGAGLHGGVDGLIAGGTGEDGDGGGKQTQAWRHGGGLLDFGDEDSTGGKPRSESQRAQREKRERREVRRGRQMRGSPCVLERMPGAKAHFILGLIQGQIHG